MQPFGNTVDVEDWAFEIEAAGKFCCLIGHKPSDKMLAWIVRNPNNIYSEYLSIEYC